MMAFPWFAAAVGAFGVGLGCNALTGVDPPEHLGSGGQGRVSSTTASASSSAATSSSGASGTGGVGQGLPNLADATHLQLWLTADQGFDCDTATGRVKAWRDESGHGRDTSTGYGQLPPQCNVHTLGSLPVPFFDSPTPTDDMFVDGTLDVDLSFLRHSDYTIFVVERRWADRVVGSSDSCMLLGTTLVPGYPTCGTGAAYTALADGYVYYTSSPQIITDFTCVSCGSPIALVPTVPPGAANIYMNRFTFANGMEVWVNGESIASLADRGGLQTASAGALGRAVYLTGRDTRYIGDIAEVVMFDTGLGADDQAAMESYLKEHWAQPFVPP